MIKGIIQRVKTTKNYQYDKIVIMSKDIIDYDIVRKWNYGADIDKHGAYIELSIRKPLK